MSSKARVIEYEGLTFRGGYSVPYLRKTCRNMAGLLTAMLHSLNDGMVYKGGIVRAAVNHGLITDKPRELTAEGHAWLRAYAGEVAPLADILRAEPMPVYTRTERAAKGIAPKARAPKPKPKPVKLSAIARDLTAAGLLFVHPTVLDVLGAECFYLWAYSRTHRHLTTVAALAAALHWDAEHTKIRAERCADRGYPLQIDQQEDAA